jgi:para-nitrobenzyl esterase
VSIAGSASQRGSSISFLAMSPLAKGLFQTAVSGSQFPIPAAIDPPRKGPPPFLLKVAEAAGQQYVASRGVKTTAELRKLSTEDLLKGPEAGGPAAPGSNVRQVYQPIVDGWLIPMHYNEAAAGGQHLPGAFVVGNDANEGGARTDAAIAAARNAGPDTRGRAEPKLTLADYTAWAKARFGDRYDQFIKLYPAADDDQAAHQNSAIIQDYARVASYLWAVGWFKAAGRPLYTFYWDHAPPGRGGGDGGAGHGSEIEYAFNNLGPGRAWTDNDRRIADIMSSYWANIAKTGNPNGPGVPVWPAVDPNSAMTMELGEHFAPMPSASPERVAFWRTFFLANQGG